MKNQLDLIVTVTSLVLAAIAAIVFMQIRRTPQKPPPVTQVNLAPLVMPTADVKMANSLPAGGSGGMGAGGGMGMMMGRPGGTGAPRRGGGKFAGGNPQGGG